MVKEEYKQKLIAIIAKHLPTCKIYLFGSRVKQHHGKASDIDIALDDNKAIDGGIMSNIREDIEESTIPLFVDIVDMRDIDEIFKKEIIKTRILWKN